MNYGAMGPTASSFGITDKSHVPHTMNEANFQKGAPLQGH